MHRTGSGRAERCVCGVVMGGQEELGLGQGAVSGPIPVLLDHLPCSRPNLGLLVG